MRYYTVQVIEKKNHTIQQMDYQSEIISDSMILEVEDQIPDDLDVTNMLSSLTLYPARKPNSIIFQAIPKIPHAVVEFDPYKAIESFSLLCEPRLWYKCKAVRVEFVWMDEKENKLWLFLLNKFQMDYQSEIISDSMILEVEDQIPDDLDVTNMLSSLTLYPARKPNSIIFQAIPKIPHAVVEFDPYKAIESFSLLCEPRLWFLVEERTNRQMLIDVVGKLKKVSLQTYLHVINAGRREKRRQYNKQAYAEQKENRLRQIASGEGSSQLTTIATNVTPQATTRMNIKTPKRVPLGILEDLRVNCLASPMNDTEVIDITVCDNNTLTTPGNTVLANKENIHPFRTELLHMQKENRREYNKQAYARRKENILRQIASGEGSSQITTIATNVTPQSTTRMNIKTPERVPLGILEDLRVNCSASPMNDTEVIDMTVGATHISLRLTFESENGIRDEPCRLLPSFDVVMTQASPITEGCIDGNVSPSIIGDNQDVDPYDFIYHGVLKQHRVLKEQPPCPLCGAKHIKFKFPTFCCMKGKTQLVSSNIPEELFNLFTSQSELGKVFRHNIRAYNMNFSFTSMGVNLDTSMTNMTSGVYSFRAHGGMYHKIDQLVPRDGQPRLLAFGLKGTTTLLHINETLLCMGGPITQPRLNLTLLFTIRCPMFCSFPRQSMTTNEENANNVGNQTNVHTRKRKYISKYTPGQKDSQAYLDEQKEKRRQYNKQAYAEQKENRLRQIASGEGSSQLTTIATNVTPQATTRMNIKKPKRVPLGILEDLRVNCLASPMNDTKVIDMTKIEESLFRFRTWEIDTQPQGYGEDVDRSPYNKQAYAWRKENILRQIASGEGSSQITTIATNVTPQSTTRMNIKTPERVPLEILEDLRVNCSASPMNDTEVIDMTVGATHKSLRLTFESENGIRDEPCRLLPSFDTVMTQASPITEGCIDGNGKTKLVASNIPEELFNLFTSQSELGKVFRHNIRAYNMNFSFTSMGVNLDTFMTNMTSGVYTFRAHGGPLDEYIVTLNASMELDQRNYNLPTTYEVAGIWIEGNNNITAYKRDIVMKVYASSPLLLCPKAVIRLLPKSETGFVRLRFTLLVEEDSGGVSSSSSRPDKASSNAQAGQKTHDPRSMWKLTNQQPVYVRKRGSMRGRLVYVNPAEEERFYLRLLLTRVCGTTKWKDLYTVNNVLYQTFRRAALERGLIKNDNALSTCFGEGSLFQFPSALRWLFTTLLIFCEPEDVRKLWDDHYESFSEDFRRAYENVKVARNMVLKAIKGFLQSMGKDIDDFDLPKLNIDANLEFGVVRELQEGYSIVLEDEHLVASNSLNSDQRDAYDEILRHVDNDILGMFFIDGPGRTGKTFLYKALLAKVRSRGLIALATASSDVAANNMSGGRTAHSRFKIHINLENNSLVTLKNKVGLQNCLELPN
nr:hypothetical protein [Tanacetum cinerariifolium]